MPGGVVKPVTHSPPVGSAATVLKLVNGVPNWPPRTNCRFESNWTANATLLAAVRGNVPGPGSRSIDPEKLPTANTWPAGPTATADVVAPSPGATPCTALAVRVPGGSTCRTIPLGPAAEHVRP